MINFKSAIAAACFTLFLAPTSYGQDLQIGSNLQGLLKLAKERNPDLASMSFDADAASERVIPAGSLPDPKFRTEWRDITRMGEQRPSLEDAQLRMCPLCHHSKSHCNSKNSSTFLRQERYSSIAFTTRQLDFPAKGGEDFHFHATTIA